MIVTVLGNVTPFLGELSAQQSAGQAVSTEATVGRRIVHLVSNADGVTSFDI